MNDHKTRKKMETVFMCTSELDIFIVDLSAEKVELLFSFRIQFCNIIKKNIKS